MKSEIEELDEEAVYFEDDFADEDKEMDKAVARKMPGIRRAELFPAGQGKKARKLTDPKV